MTEVARLRWLGAELISIMSCVAYSADRFRLFWFFETVFEHTLGFHVSWLLAEEAVQNGRGRIFHSLLVAEQLLDRVLVAKNKSVPLYLSHSFILSLSGPFFLSLLSCSFDVCLRVLSGLSAILYTSNGHDHD